MYIRTFAYKASDVDCKLCTEYQKQHGCRQKVCPFLMERIEAGVVTYEKAVRALIPPNCGIWNRLEKLFQDFSGSLWADKDHKSRIEMLDRRLGYNKKRNTPAYYAAMFLLTSNESIYRRTGNCFYSRGVELSYAVLKGISTHDYALYCAAKSFYQPAGITVSELADPAVIDPEAFRLIINALLIAKYGTAVFNLKEE